MEEVRWLLCPCCHSKTRMKLREDTVIDKFLLFCPKCKKEMLINVKNYQVEVIEKTLYTVRRWDAVLIKKINAASFVWVSEHIGKKKKKKNEKI